MNPKNIFIPILLLLSILNYSCFDRNNFTHSTSQTVLQEDESTMSELLTNTFENVNDTIHLAFRGQKLKTTSLIEKLYAQNQMLPIWTSGMKPNQDANELMNLFARSAYYGLDTSFYQYSSLKELYNVLNDKSVLDVNSKALEYEILMTHNCYKLMKHLKIGVLKSDTAIYGERYLNYPGNFAKKLGKFINKGHLTEGILALQPNTYQYKQLQKGLESFLDQMALTTDSFSMPNPETDSVMAYQQAKEILEANNFYNPNHTAKDLADCVVKEITNFDSEPIAYTVELKENPKKDSAFIAALKKFQQAHGLHSDGKIGTNTKNALTINNRERFEQIAINLERLKWEQRKPARYVYVNIPAYKLHVVDEHMIIKNYILVVGAKWTKTPLLNSQIEYFITNPAWNVPASISRNELLPKIKRDSNYLKRNNYRIYDSNSQRVKNVDWSQIERGNFNYRIQQGPGRGNALGNVKYIFPNKHNVYIHDTQAKSKFSKEIRAYSHGCMRIAEPIEFGKTLLSFENKAAKDSIEGWINSGVRRKYDLAEPIPVYVRYVTCEASSKANIIFYHDIYGRDKALRQKLFASSDI